MPVTVNLPGWLTRSGDIAWQGRDNRPKSIGFRANGVATVSPETTLAAFACSYTATALVITGTALSGKIDYNCWGN